MKGQKTIILGGHAFQEDKPLDGMDIVHSLVVHYFKHMLAVAPDVPRELLYHGGMFVADTNVRAWTESLPVSRKAKRIIYDLAVGVINTDIEEWIENAITHANPGGTSDPPAGGAEPQESKGWVN